MRSQGCAIEWLTLPLIELIQLAPDFLAQQAKLIAFIEQPECL